MASRRVLVQVPSTGALHDLTGRAAEMVVLMCAHADTINGVPVGALTLDFAHSTIKPSLRQTWAPVALG